MQYTTFDLSSQSSGGVTPVHVSEAILFRKPWRTAQRWRPAALRAGQVQPALTRTRRVLAAIMRGGADFRVWRRFEGKILVPRMCV